MGVIIDPPFGAKTELIWESLDRLKQRAEMLSCSVSIFFLWVFPYFMEKQVTAVAPELQMADYRVTYSKHKQFKEGKGERGSIVRIFTNINLSELVLPPGEGYPHCPLANVGLPHPTLIVIYARPALARMAAHTS